MNTPDAFDEYDNDEIEPDEDGLEPEWEDEEDGDSDLAGESNYE